MNLFSHTGICRHCGYPIVGTKYGPNDIDWRHLDSRKTLQFFTTCTEVDSNGLVRILDTVAELDRRQMFKEFLKEMYGDVL